MQLLWSGNGLSKESIKVMRDSLVANELIDVLDVAKTGESWSINSGHGKFNVSTLSYRISKGYCS